MAAWRLVDEGGVCRGIDTGTLATAAGARSVAERLLWSAAAGLVGAVVFGVMMDAMGTLPVVAGLVGSNLAMVGAVVHMVISATIGVGFGLFGGPMSESYGPAAIAGLVYGAIWWVLGPLVIMPS